MPPPSPASDRTLHHALEQARRRASRERPVTVALRLAAPREDPLEGCVQNGTEHRFFWEQPRHDRAFATQGALRVLECQGEGRFEAASRGARALFDRLVLLGDPGPLWTGPLLVGGFAFHAHAPPEAPWRGFPAGRLVLPRHIVARSGARAWHTRIALLTPESDIAAEAAAFAAFRDRTRARPEPGRAGAQRQPAEGASVRTASAREARPALRTVPVCSPARFLRRASDALEAVRSGALEKLVVARAVEVPRAGGFDVGNVLTALRAAQPGCTLFAAGHPGATFLGATPEHLVKLEGRRVHTAAVAGTAPRGRGATEDAALARALRESKKEQTEHAVVVREVREALEAVCERVEAPEAPEVLRLAGIQHLSTPVRGRLRAGTSLSVLDLVARLHPTPAVGGAPRERALAWLARHEELQRGWYAGPIGWVDPAGGGEFVVALRTALLGSTGALLYAGAGIVEGSRPVAELRETELKLRAVLRALAEA